VSVIGLLAVDAAHKNKEFNLIIIVVIVDITARIKIKKLRNENTSYQEIGPCK
jgi:hypothetical protein